MPRKPGQQELFEELLRTYEREIADAFRRAVVDLRRGADLARVIDALARRDINSAVAALNLSETAYTPLYEALARSYAAGGQGAVDTMPLLKEGGGARLIIRFDGRNRRAEAWLRSASSTLITRTLADQREAVRTHLTNAMEKGANPRSAGLDIVGRISRATGEREGGVLGLSAPQEAAVEAARVELSSGEPAALRRYLERARRDKRFDRSIAKAIREEKPLPAETASKAILQYKNRLLDLRGETIGLTEALSSLNAARHEAYVQAVDQGKFDATAVRRTWDDVGDRHVRHTHRGLNGDTVGLYEAFTSSSGARLMFPGDTSLGAPASEVVRCRCGVKYRIDRLSNLR